MKLKFWDKSITENFDELRSLLATRENYFSEFDYGNMDELIDNPNKILRDQSINLKSLEKITYDPHVASCIQSRKSGVLSLEWETTESKDKQVNDLIEKSFSMLDVRTIIEEMLDAPLYGFIPCEVYWDYYDGYLLPYKIASKPVWWFKWDKFDLLRFMDKNHSQGVVCPPMKFIAVRHLPRFHNPYGDPLLSKCLYPVLMKKENLKLWGTSNTKYGMPFMVGTTEFDKQSSLLMQSLEKLQADGVTVVPAGTTINFLQGSNVNGEAYQRFIDFQNREISKILLSQTLSTEQGESGSYALGKAHLEVRESVVQSDKSLIEAAFNKLITWIIKINIGEVPVIPKFVLFKPADVDKNLADRDKVLYDMGTRFNEQYRNVAYGFKDDEFEIKAESEEIQPLEPQNDIQGTLKFSEQTDENIPEIPLDEFTKANNKLLKPIVDMINNAKNYDEITDEISKLFPELDTDAVEELIAQGILIANISAYENIKKVK